MKIIFIVGLEHSGSTLTNHLLGRSPSALALGEVASFFSPPHMKQYMERWGSFSDVSLCSCGVTWTQCEFWAALSHLWGLNSDASMLEKYKILLEHIRATHGEDTIVVDSSKSLSHLKLLCNGHLRLDLSADDIHVVFAVKDVRSFAASMANKADVKRSFASVYRSFNYWTGVNKQIFDYLKQSKLNFSINLYEQLCADPKSVINKHLSMCGGGLLDDVEIGHNTSHIAMGNKNFLVRNRKQIKYDSRWFNDDAVNLSYLIHRKARPLNKQLYSLC